VIKKVSCWLQADIRPPPINVRCTPKSGHSGIHVRFLTDYVRFTPKSRHEWIGRGMSAYDPLRTLAASLVHGS
jgi:hypothetical protein